VGPQADPGDLLVLGGLSAYAFSIAESATLFLGSLFFVGFFNLGAWGAVYPYTSELYPTRLRSSALSVCLPAGAEGRLPCSK
jgi:putative MFS transporter